MNIASLNVIVDINKDGSYSVWEVWETAKVVYRLPGNLIIEALGNTPHVSSLLNIQASQDTGYASLNGSLAVTLSLLFWVVAISSILTLASPSDEYDDIPEAREIENSNVAKMPMNSSPHARAHLPVSRVNYPAPGKRQKRRRHTSHASRLWRAGKVG